ncbi:MAG: hypothetical protein HY236_17385, partial [Acidobacteria bacterium]|nr:hypothetical protein [Acidobacteriota bacterium]
MRYGESLRVAWLLEWRTIFLAIVFAAALLYIARPLFIARPQTFTPALRLIMGLLVEPWVVRMMLRKRYRGFRLQVVEGDREPEMLPEAVVTPLGELYVQSSPPPEPADPGEVALAPSYEDALSRRHQRVTYWRAIAIMWSLNLRMLLYSVPVLVGLGTVLLIFPPGNREFVLLLA